MQQRLGKIAYEAANRDILIYKAWEYLTPNEQEQWHMAAAAVVDEYSSQRAPVRYDDARSLSNSRASGVPESFRYVRI